ncbi:hypothetical protein J6590_077267 [Homalodisca vitripennis]|nr:hypothetical protein J6590_077267 [Homalodisca vitripennis]
MTFVTVLNSSSYLQAILRTWTNKFKTGHKERKKTCREFVVAISTLLRRRGGFQDQTQKTFEVYQTYLVQLSSYESLIRDRALFRQPPPPSQSITPETAYYTKGKRRLEFVKPVHLETLHPFQKKDIKDLQRSRETYGMRRNWDFKERRLSPERTNRNNTLPKVQRLDHLTGPGPRQCTYQRREDSLQGKAAYNEMFVPRRKRIIGFTDGKPFESVKRKPTTFQEWNDWTRGLTCISSEVSKYLDNKNTPTKDTSLRIHLADNRKVGVSKTYTFPCTLQNKDTVIEAIHVTKLSTPVILGMDYIPKLNLIEMNFGSDANGPKDKDIGTSDFSAPFVRGIEPLAERIIDVDPSPPEPLVHQEVVLAPTNSSKLSCKIDPLRAILNVRRKRGKTNRQRILLED